MAESRARPTQIILHELADKMIVHQEVYRTIYDGRPGHIHQTKSTSPRGNAIFLTDYFTNEVGRGRPFALTIDADGVTSRSVIYQSGFTVRYPTTSSVMEGLHRSCTSTKHIHTKISIGVYAVVHTFQPELSDVIYDSNTKEKYQNLDQQINN